MNISATNGYSRPRFGLMASALLFVVGLIAIFIAMRPKPTVEEQIRQSFVQMQSAAKQGDITGATDILSEDFHAGSLTRRKVRLLLFEEGRNSEAHGYDVQFTDPQVLPTDDNAPDDRLVVTQITANSLDGGPELWNSGRTPLTLRMHREEQRIWLFFPVTKWRILSAPAVPGGIGDL